MAEDHDINRDPKRYVFNEGLGHVDCVQTLADGVIECPGTGAKDIEVDEPDASEGLIFPWQKDDYEPDTIPVAQIEAMDDSS